MPDGRDTTALRRLLLAARDRAVNLGELDAASVLRDLVDKFRPARPRPRTPARVGVELDQLAAGPEYAATITLTREQLRLTAEAYTLFVDLGLGRYEDLAEFALTRVERAYDPATGGCRPFTADDRDALAAAVRPFEPAPHGNLGLGRGSPAVHSAYQLLKAVQRAVYEAEDQAAGTGSLGTVLADGVSVRYAPDPVAAITVTRGGRSWAVQTDHTNPFVST